MAAVAGRVATRVPNTTEHRRAAEIPAGALHPEEIMETSLFPDGEERGVGTATRSLCEGTTEGCEIHLDLAQVREIMLDPHGQPSFSSEKTVLRLEALTLPIRIAQQANHA